MAQGPRGGLRGGVTCGNAVRVDLDIQTINLKMNTIHCDMSLSFAQRRSDSPVCRNISSVSGDAPGLSRLHY
jgi:chorismate synthase